MSAPELFARPETIGAFDAVLRLTENPDLRRAMGERARRPAEKSHSDSLLPLWLKISTERQYHDKHD